MSAIEERLNDYRELRDSAKTTLLADIDHARATFSAKGLTNRYFGGVAEGAKDVYEVAKVHAVDHRGLIAIVLGALALWLGREPLLSALAEEIEKDGDPSPKVHQEETEAAPEEPSSGDTNDN